MESTSVILNEDPVLEGPQKPVFYRKSIALITRQSARKSNPILSKKARQNLAEKDLG